MNTMPDAFTGAFVSKICNAILDYWSVILQQETWAFRQDPEPFNRIEGSSPPSSVEPTDPDNTNSHDFDKNGGISHTYDTAEAKMDEGQTANDSKLDHWSMMRFLLNQERDQLYLWRNDFSQNDLDRIMSNKSNEVGSAVLGSLVGIGRALLDETDGVSLPGVQDSSRKELKELVQIGTEFIKHICFDDDGAGSVASIESSESSGAGPVVLNVKRENIHEIVKFHIAQLQALPFSFR